MCQTDSPLPLIKVWIKKVGEVLALVDTGASIYAVKTCTVKYLENKREGKILKFMRGITKKSELVVSYHWVKNGRVKKLN